MSNQDLILNVATNLGRLGRWSYEGNTTRIPQFLADTQIYLGQIQQVSPKFSPTYDLFLKDYSYLASTPPGASAWSDIAFTWAAILSHRAKLA